MTKFNVVVTHEELSEALSGFGPGKVTQVFVSAKAAKITFDVPEKKTPEPVEESQSSRLVYDDAGDEGDAE